MTTKQKRLTLGFLLLFVAAYIGTGSAPWLEWAVLTLGYLGGLMIYRKPKETH